jgi:hypothetical protein
MASLHEARAAELATETAKLAALRKERAATDDSRLALERELGRVEAGDYGDPRGHLKHPHRPVPETSVRYGRIVEFWSAVSVGILLLAIVGLVSLRLVPWWGALLIAFSGYVVLESAFRRQLTLLTLRVELTLAIIGAAILIWEGMFIIVIAAIAALALVIVLDNVRELRAGGGSGRDASASAVGSPEDRGTGAETT